MKEAQPRAIRLKDYRPYPYTVESLDLQFDLHDDHARVTAVSRFRRKPDAPAGEPLWLAGVDLTTESLQLDGRDLRAGEDYRPVDEGILITDVPDAFELRCVTRLAPQDNTSLEGLYRSHTMFCTQCEAEGFRKITYFPDRPDVLTVFTVTLEADRRRFPVLLSNGNPVDAGESGDRHWARWHDPFPKPSYLFALVAGDLVYREDAFTTASGRDVRLRIYVESKDLAKTAFAMDALVRAMRWDETTYGREYDLDVFNVVAVDDFNMGAMENKGLNIFNTSCVLAHPSITTDAGYRQVEGVVAHEYFHNWSGNRVTCRDWFQLSLKEGFTVFRDTEFSADMGSRAAKRIEDVASLRSLQFPEDAGPMAHPVQPDSYMEIGNFYTLTVYEKGAEVVRMLYHLLGPEAFRRGADRYFETYDGQAVTIDEFLDAMATAGERDLTQFRRWYTQAGTPRLHVNGEYDADARTYTLTVRQSCPPTPGQPDKTPLLIPLAMGLVGESGSLPLYGDAVTEPGTTTAVLNLTEAEQRFVFEQVPEAPRPSLLRGFSAPVRLDCPLDETDLLFLARHDDDGFARYEAVQRLAVETIQTLTRARRQGEAASVSGAFLDLMRALLVEAHDDRMVQAMLLRLPNMSYLIDQGEAVDVPALFAAREQVREALARHCADDWRAVFEREAPERPYRVDGEAMARRALRNTCLSYLALLDDGSGLTLAQQQWDAADNMTDRLASLAAVVHSRLPDAPARADALLTDAESRWADEPLAMNQWFQVQATAPVADIRERLERLMAHPAFSLTNPNKVRAVIGAFSNANPAGFHAEDGSGYAFLAERIRELDALNPQVAARLMTPLTRWRQYRADSRDRMLDAVRGLRQAGNLSRDLEEVVIKTLAEAP